MHDGTSTAATVSTTKRGWADSLTGRFLEALFAAYEREGVRYVVLRNYTKWPEDFGKDVDMVVDEADVQRSHTIIRGLAQEMGLYCQGLRKRSTHLSYRLLPAPVDGVERGVFLDLRTDVVHMGFIYLPGRMALATRRRHDRFYVMSPALEALGMILHCVIDARHVRPSYRERLSELGTGKREEFLAAGAAVVGEGLAARLADCLERKKPEAALRLRRRIFWVRTRRHPLSLAAFISGKCGAAWDRVSGWVRPRGVLVVLVGPDGSGKTTLCNLVCERFHVTHVPTSPVYLGAQKPLLPTRLLSQKLHKKFGRPGKVKPIKDVDRRQRLRGLAHILADKWLRYIVHVRPRLARNEVVVLDRYFYDLLTFPHPLVRHSFVESLVMHLIPRPAIIFCLQADPAVIAVRKNELTVAETARQIECFRGLRRWISDFHEVPADGDIKSVVDAITEHVMRIYTRERSPERVVA